MTTLREKGLKLLLTSEAQEGYQELVETGSVYLDLLEEEDPDRIRQIKNQESKLQGQVETLETKIEALLDLQEEAIEERDFWQNEMIRLEKNLNSNHLTVYSYKLEQGKPVFRRGKAKVEDSRTYRLDSREAQKSARKAVTKLKREYLQPWYNQAKARSKKLHKEIQELQGRKSALEEQISTLQDNYVDPDLASKEIVRYARYWEDFLTVLASGGPGSRHLKPLKHKGKDLFRYRRGRMRILFKRFPDFPRVFHILRITLRDDDTYKGLSSLLSESNRYAM